MSFEFKTLDKWMEELEESIYTQYTTGRDAIKTFKQTRKDQVKFCSLIHPSSDVQISENIQTLFRAYSSFCYIPGNWEEKVSYVEYFPHGISKEIAVVHTIVIYITINDKKYSMIALGPKVENESRIPLIDLRKIEESVKNQFNTGLGQFIVESGSTVTAADRADGRSDEWCRDKAHKEMLQQKRTIEEKVKKICGDEITEVNDSFDGIYVKGSNGRVAHLWKISAGGYNIQCLHTRVLVKEMK